jgi:hypothetical protein
MSFRVCIDKSVVQVLHVYFQIEAFCSLAAKYVMKCHLFCTEGLRLQFVSLRSRGLLLVTLKKKTCVLPT